MQMMKLRARNGTLRCSAMVNQAAHRLVKVYNLLATSRHHSAPHGPIWHHGHGPSGILQLQSSRTALLSPLVLRAPNGPTAWDSLGQSVSKSMILASQKGDVEGSRMESRDKEQQNTSPQLPILHSRNLFHVSICSICGKS